jgi:hypothetical protein
MLRQTQGGHCTGPALQVPVQSLAGIAYPSRPRPAGLKGRGILPGGGPSPVRRVLCRDLAYAGKLCATHFQLQQNSVYPRQV